MSTQSFELSSDGESAVINLDLLLTLVTRKYFVDGWDGIYKSLNFMTGDNLWSHQLVRANREALPYLQRWHPWTATIDIRDYDREEAVMFLLRQRALRQSHYTIWRISAADHQVINPFDEMMQAGVDEDKIIRINRDSE